MVEFVLGLMAGLGFLAMISFSIYGTIVVVKRLSKALEEL